MKRLHVVAAIIENDQFEVLLAQRPAGKHLAGLWEFPGGKVEAGEAATDALHRELREELALNVEIQKNLGLFPYTYEWGVVELDVFVVRASNTPQASEQVQVFRWCTPESVILKELAPADREPLLLYLRSLRPKTD